MKGSSWRQVFAKAAGQQSGQHIHSHECRHTDAHTYTQTDTGKRTFECNRSWLWPRILVNKLAQKLQARLMHFVLGILNQLADDCHLRQGLKDGSLVTASAL